MVDGNELVGSSQDRYRKLKAYLEYDKSNISLLLQLIPIGIDLQEWDDVAEYIQLGLSVAPESADISAHAGFAALREAKLGLAIQYFETATGAGLVNTAVQYNLAYCYYLSSRFTCAHELSHLIQDDAGLERCLPLLKARCCLQLGLLDEGITILVSLESREHLSAEASAVLAILYCDSGQGDLALKYANSALSEDQSQIEALIARASVAMDAMQYDTAFADFTRVVEMSTEIGRAWSGIGQISLYNFNFDEALESLNKAVLLLPEHIGTWHALAWVKLLKEDYEGSKAAFECSLELDRNFGETHGGLASVFELLGNTERALHHKRLAKRLAPNGLASMFSEYLALIREGKADEAITYFESFKRSPHPVFKGAPVGIIDNRLAELKEASKSKAN